MKIVFAVASLAAVVVVVPCTSFSVVPSAVSSSPSVRCRSAQQPSQQRLFSSINKNNDRRPPTTTKSWQDDLEELLNVQTTPARRQLLLQQLLNANRDIQQSVQKALQEQSIDPLLTPTGKKLQDGTRAVARQLSNDILPSLLESATQSSRQKRPFPLLLLPPPPPLPPRPPQPRDVQTFANQLFSTFQTQVEQFQNDISSITSSSSSSSLQERLSQQTKTILDEAQNIFSDTPVGLKEPPYQVLETTTDYEIRLYETYTCAVTQMRRNNNKDSEKNDYSTIEVMDESDPELLASQGAAFNTLASYLFGGNQESKAMSMTTPVTTTTSGDMRFYLSEDEMDPSGSFPAPSVPKQTESTSISSSSSASTTVNTASSTISIETIPAARLAVRRFTGFCTAGEIARQKQALLAALELDGIALDIEHGQTVGHVVFQYNPPYTLPVLRRNELAVPVLPKGPRPPRAEWVDEDEEEEKEILGEGGRFE